MKAAADAEVYGVIQEKTPDVPGMHPEFSIEENKEWEASAGLPRVVQPREEMGESAEAEVGAWIISLEKALEIAVKRNRQYQNRKESVYLQALSLTLERHRYTPIFSAVFGGQVDRDTRDVSEASTFSQATGLTGDVLGALETLTGQPADLLNQYQAIVEEAGALAGLDRPETRIEERYRSSGQTRAGVDLLLKSGGRIAVDLTSNFLRFLTGDPSTSSSSALVGNLTQPLLRGRGSRVAAERLTQAERDLLYALRDFTQYRKDFSIEICTAYYGVLENLDVVRNNWRGLQNFRRSVARERALTVEGRRTPAGLGRIEQAEYSRENSWIESVRRYRESLDRFKIQLGLSTDAPTVLNERELESLRETGLRHPTLSAEEAVAVALAARLDLYNEHDRIADAERRVGVAADALKPSLDFVMSGSVETPPGGNYTDLDLDRTRWSAGFDTDLDLDKKAERNAYRAALIDYERASRAFTLAEDNVKLAVRERWRSLEQAKRNYEIALKSVGLNQRRVEEQDLLAELGRATVLDQVDAQNDLTASENDLTAALVRHTIARLEFWRDMGILYIKENGQWEDVVDDAVERPSDVAAAR
ncbi:MAG TPA: TolC family protein [Candidatus Hydrogenedentes bacterium]|nr:TolC family protein [Candidatus Hydrogenedentota bacterium]